MQASGGLAGPAASRRLMISSYCAALMDAGLK